MTILNTIIFLSFFVFINTQEYKIEYVTCSVAQASINATEIIIPNGGAGVLQCDVQGEPKPTVTWSKKNHTVVDGKHIIYDQVGDKLGITGVEPKDGGDYTCTANNNFGAPATATVRVTIVDPIENAVQITLGEFAIQNFELFKPAKVYCLVKGWPRPYIKWDFNAKLINFTNNDKYIKYSNYVLLIRNFTKDDVGKYTCKAFQGNDDKLAVSEIIEVGYIIEDNKDNEKPIRTVKKCISPNITTAQEQKSSKNLINVDYSLRHDAAFEHKPEDVKNIVNLLQDVFSFPLATGDQIEMDINTTTSILRSLNEILNTVYLKDNATVLEMTPQAALLVTESQRSKVDGIMVTTSNGRSLSNVKPLHVGIKDEDENDASLVVRIIGDFSNDSRMSFIVYGNGRIFPPYYTKAKIDSLIVSVNITREYDECRAVQYKVKPFTTEIPSDLKRYCAYWSEEKYDWLSEGCSLIRNDKETVECKCSCFTHFGVVLGLRGNSIYLHTISLIGSTFSLIGLLGITMTAILFSKWRSQLGNKILLHLSFSIGSILIIFFIVTLEGSPGGSDNWECVTLGVLLHYFILGSFCWMLVTAILQFSRLVTVFNARPPRFLLKGSLFAWGIPLIPIITLFVIDKNSYENHNQNLTICYPQKSYLLFSVIVPVSLIVGTNLIIFAMIIYNITCGKVQTIQVNSNEDSDRKLFFLQIKMSILLFFLLGLTWIFGLMAVVVNENTWKNILVFIFCTLATFQGFTLFLFFIILCTNTRNLWIKMLIDKLEAVSGDDDSSWTTIMSKYLRGGGNYNTTYTVTVDEKIKNVPKSMSYANLTKKEDD